MFVLTRFAAAMGFFAIIKVRSAEYANTGWCGHSCPEKFGQVAQFEFG